MTLAEVVETSEIGRHWAETRARVLKDCHRLQIDPRSPLFDRIESISRLQALAEAWQEQGFLLEEARESVRQRLCKGDLGACGFVGNGAQPQQLVALPPEMWNEANAIDWDSGSMVAHSNVFVDIRVVPRPRERLEGDPASTPLAPPVPG